MNLLDNCVCCFSDRVYEDFYDAKFYFEGREYKIKAIYTKCKSCGAEYYSKSQVEKNQNYLKFANTEVT